MAFHDEPFRTFERILETHLACAPRGLPAFIRAIPLLLRVVEILPPSPDARIRLAEALVRAGRPGEAIARCQALLRHRPGDAGARETMALAAAQLQGGMVR